LARINHTLSFAFAGENFFHGLHVELVLIAQGILLEKNQMSASSGRHIPTIPVLTKLVSFALMFPQMCQS
jgi:hypothetical protein